MPKPRGQGSRDVCQELRISGELQTTSAYAQRVDVHHLSLLELLRSDLQELFVLQATRRLAQPHLTDMDFQYRWAIVSASAVFRSWILPESLPSLSQRKAARELLGSKAARQARDALRRNMSLSSYGDHYSTAKAKRMALSCRGRDDHESCLTFEIPSVCLLAQGAVVLVISDSELQPLVCHSTPPFFEKQPARNGPRCLLC